MEGCGGAAMLDASCEHEWVHHVNMLLGAQMRLHVDMWCRAATVAVATEETEEQEGALV